MGRRAMFWSEPSSATYDDCGRMCPVESAPHHQRSCRTSELGLKRSSSASTAISRRSQVTVNEPAIGACAHEVPRCACQAGDRAADCMIPQMKAAAGLQPMQCVRSTRRASLSVIVRHGDMKLVAVACLAHRSVSAGWDWQLQQAWELTRRASLSVSVTAWQQHEASRRSADALAHERVSARDHRLAPAECSALPISQHRFLRVGQCTIETTQHRQRQDRRAAGMSTANTSPVHPRPADHDSRHDQCHTPLRH